VRVSPYAIVPSCWICAPSSALFVVSTLSSLAAVHATGAAKASEATTSRRIFRMT